MTEEFGKKAQKDILLTSEGIPLPSKEIRRFMRMLFDRKIVLFAAIVIFALIGVASFTPFIAPHDPYRQDLNKVLLSFSRQHLLGTDPLGRDVLSRIIFGTRASLLVSIVAVGIAAVIGMMLGLIGGYFGGIVNAFIMRFIDALMALPPLILALAIAAVLGGGLRNVVIALGIAMLPSFCRLMCSQVLSVKETDYVMAGRVIGASHLRIMFRYVLPNCLPPLIVLITLQMGVAILAEAGLSFLGVGIRPPATSWGAMIFSGYRYLNTHPLLSFAPGLCIILVVLSFNLLGDGMRDALDPRLRGTV